MTTENTQAVAIFHHQRQTNHTLAATSSNPMASSLDDVFAVLSTATRLEEEDDKINAATKVSDHEMAHLKGCIGTQSLAQSAVRSLLAAVL